MTEQNIPIAHRLSITHVGRNVFTIDGRAGLFMMKPPAAGELRIEVVARTLVGRGRAPKTFYGLPRLEQQLAGALRGIQWSEE
jgi:hypothetical protein